MPNDSIFNGKKYDSRDLVAAIRSHPAGKGILDKEAHLTPQPKVAKKVAQPMKRVR